jgi:signal transduction histidine kinase
MFWYAVVLLVSMIIVGGFSYYEFVIEPRLAAKSGEPTDTFSVEVIEVLLYAGLPSVLLALASGWWLTRKAFDPVEKLTTAAENLNTGNLKQQLPVSGSGDEIDRLTQVFNAMTARLDESFQRVREFTLHASHELKTPLTIMRSEVETAIHVSEISAAERERFASLLDEVERLTEIVDALTFLTKADAGLLNFNKQPVRLDELVREAFADAQVLAAQSGINVRLEQCEAATILAERHRIRQLLLILTDNAIKYNKSGGTVSLAVELNGSAELRVTNTGPGILSQDVPRVFERFFRGQHSETRHTEGCGLGLSIAGSIVSIHDGRIEVNSEPNGLTTFRVSFPPLTRTA